MGSLRLTHPTGSKNLKGEICNEMVTDNMCFCLFCWMVLK